MHPSISQHRAILDGLRDRTRLVTAEFYQKPNITAPAWAPRFIVKPKGNNIFEVIERVTGKLITERITTTTPLDTLVTLKKKPCNPISKKRAAFAQFGFADRPCANRMCFFGIHL